jgi:predicted O-linked N-acetylglucosamine transferase (SPINDLY family)
LMGGFIAAQPTPTAHHFRQLASMHLAAENRLEAALVLTKAVELAPDDSQSWCELGKLWYDLGLSRRGHRCLLKALEIAPDNPGHQMALLFYLPATAGLTDAQRLTFCRQWAARYMDPLQITAQASLDMTERPLRIGYVSADFKLHAAANDLIPLFQFHRRSEFTIYAYAHMAPDAADDITRWFREQSDVWRDVYTLDDEALVAQIRADAIDVLVDCSGFSGGNRLPVFARKPAPIQISAFGFVFTTGMRAIDYQFSDAVATPVARQSHFSERMIHLGSQINWAPLTEQIAALEVGEPPSRQRGYITFGSGNAAFKHNEAVFPVWAEILKRVPHSRLHFKHRRFEDRGVQASFRQAFAKLGVDPARLDFTGFGSVVGQMEFYQTIDIALDPFPYTGGMTTCELLFMGVPVVALNGDGVRTSPSLLTLVGASELLASSPAAYVQIAVALAENPERLQHYRQTLRAQLDQSPMMDAPGFVAQVEHAYRTVWRSLPSEA